MTEQNPADDPFGVETNLIRKTIIVTNNIDKEEFEFRIPTLMDEIAIGGHMRRMRLQADPLDDGQGVLDGDTMAWLRAATYFERQLISSSVDWPYTKLPDGTRVVRASEFPIDKVNNVLIVAGLFHTEVSRFRAGGTTHGGNAGDKVVAGS